MKKKTAIIVYMVLLSLTFLTVGGILLTTKLSIAREPSGASLEDTYDDGAKLIESDIIETIPGTTTEMLSYEYWADKAPDKELFTPEEIQSINENNPQFVKFKIDTASWRNKLFINNLPETIDGEIVKALVEAMYEKDFVEKSPTLYVDGKEIEAGYIDGLIEAAALEKIPEEVTPKYAINLTRTVAKIFPTLDFASESLEDTYFDSFISAEVMPCEGVVVLHESADGEYSYILIGSYLGWVKTDNLAICSSKEEWLSYTKPEEFLVVTGSEIVLEETAENTASSGMILPMGTKIRLSKEIDDEVNGRGTYGCYEVDIPVRGENGQIAVEKALLPVSKDVNVGFLPMTSRNVLKQAFKFLGKVYGYGGALSSNDCSGFVRQVYACFGLELPRNASAIANMSDLGSVETSKMSVDAKKKLLSETLPGMPVFMSGHLMLYIGSEAGEPYVISSCATFIEPGNTNDDIVDAYCVFVSDMNLLRKNGKTWLEDTSYILNKEY